ncbi:MAG: 1-(5-phosphoribosyl)-5-((5-phosphoribosylamino)methylideneamino)imidazole-4-carboxamide isomerase [Candidatus Muproteobacteria bacterium RBG_16_65_34]|uniref:1-(5-phosphoribosyl)-5-((5-phosphoribosylamino)methylideneamino)imidazole-4-carboxamide isomerase n=1 Tax=Candidatus Muproteobacteria bacterium RBG_16_65_34 TaxID=1817760 RepID=A0A1F6TMF4_9PROT|nr:MAG: 1-(5-phosphoribosyl)-5-((5-phosphoribosylamino)methylideneamino)imidazole-4-carboxamide isomerase [Candidatus Muproteobacteria bacterium RBG_16_65_34]
MRKNTVRPTDIKLHQKSRVLEIAFDDGSHFNLPCEYLRVYSPSAEVRGHGPGQEVLQLGKENVNITQIEPVGSYAVTLHFDDGHNTGIYSWDWLHHLGKDHDELWKRYLERLEKSGYKRKEIE